MSSDNRTDRELVDAVLAVILRQPPINAEHMERAAARVGERVGVDGATVLRWRELGQVPPFLRPMLAGLLDEFRA